MNERDEIDGEMVEMIEDLEAISIELWARTNTEVLCSLFGGILHGIVCSDDSIPEETKAAYTAVTIGKYLTPSAIDHFDTDNLPERIGALTETVAPERLH